MITVIDYGGSNMRSVMKAFERIGARLQVATEAAEIHRAQKLVLPGVGAFAAAGDRNAQGHQAMSDSHEIILLEIEWREGYRSASVFLPQS